MPTTGSANSLRVQNMAAVFMAATLPPFAEPGTKLDVTVSSAGDARSLNGGLLLMTPLYGPDGRIYAEAQGPIVLGGYAAAANGNAKVVNHPDGIGVVFPVAPWSTWCAGRSVAIAFVVHIAQ